LDDYDNGFAQGIRRQIPANTGLCPLSAQNHT